EIDDENGYNSEDKIQELQELIQFLISKGKLGSSLLISTELFLTYILNQKCPTCQNKNINEKRYKIKVIELSVKIIVTCYHCQVETFYGNEIPGIEFSNLVAEAGLAGGVNHKEIKAAAEKSANNALCVVCEKIGSNKKETLEVGFDCAWSKVREASQASAKFIYNGTPE
ncbi:3359_t:CDS:2, partial [Racocetra fulgida]